jgi:hypothetical protein
MIQPRIKATEEEEAAYQTPLSQAEATSEQAGLKGSDVKPPRSPIVAAFKEGQRRFSNIVHGDSHVTWTIPYHGGNASPFPKAIEVIGGKNGSWRRSVTFLQATDGGKLTILDMHKDLQPRRNGEDGQPFPLKVQFRLIEKITRPDAIHDVTERFEMMRLAKLSMSSDFEVELANKHDLEGENLTAEIGRIKGQLIEIGRKQGCKLVS